MCPNYMRERVRRDVVRADADAPAEDVGGIGAGREHRATRRKPTDVLRHVDVLTVGRQPAVRVELRRGHAVAYTILESGSQEAGRQGGTGIRACRTEALRLRATLRAEQSGPIIAEPRSWAHRQRALPESSGARASVMYWTVVGRSSSSWSSSPRPPGTTLIALWFLSAKAGSPSAPICELQGTPPQELGMPGTVMIAVATLPWAGSITVFVLLVSLTW